MHALYFPPDSARERERIAARNADRKGEAVNGFDRLRNREIYEAAGLLAEPPVPVVIHDADNFIDGSALVCRNRESLPHRARVPEEEARRRLTEDRDLRRSGIVARRERASVEHPNSKCIEILRRYRDLAPVPVGWVEGRRRICIHLDPAAAS